MVLARRSMRRSLGSLGGRGRGVHVDQGFLLNKTGGTGGIDKQDKSTRAGK